MANHEPRKVKLLKGDGSPLLAKKIGRNEKCACGSGKKSKNCCKMCDNTRYFSRDKIDRYTRNDGTDNNNNESETAENND